MRRHHWLAFGIGLAVALAIRLVLLPQPGLAGDDNDFLAWARWIGTNSLSRAYDQPISFPPVLPWIWWALGGVAPGLLSATPNDAMALTLLKLPATMADVAIAGIVGWSLRSRPGWSVAGMLAVLLVPATWYVSAWWGQFESLYVLPILVAWLLVARGRPGWAAVALAIGLMTKPQALPLLIPFAAWYLRSLGLRGAVRPALIGAATIAILWVPFLAGDGPRHYLQSLSDYTATFAVLSLRAWNPWWVLQDAAGGGQLIAANVPIVGPGTLRWVGVAIAGLLELAVFAWVWRRPTASGLAWGLAAASLAAFIGLTTMHERYAYAALIFLILLWPNRLAVATWVVLAVTISINLVAAVPPSGEPGSWIPIGGIVGIAGAIAMTASFVVVLRGLRQKVEAS